LKEYRQHRGMTVRELAEAAHVTPGQISRYEHGRDRISHERITEFARILRIKSNDLYQPPGSRLRRYHVRRRLMSFMAAVIAEAAALMSLFPPIESARQESNRAHGSLERAHARPQGNDGHVSSNKFVSNCERTSPAFIPTERRVSRYRNEIAAGCLLVTAIV
jgi:transcriptional regulator with XRE-family HTH domain